MKKLLKIVSTFMLLMNVSFLIAQTTSEDISAWKAEKEISGLQIYTKEIGCHDTHNGIHEQYIVYQFINSTNETMEISWQNEFWYDGKCYTCDKPASPENTYKVILAPGETTEGSCDKTSISGLKVFEHFMYTSKGNKLTKQELKNLNISFK